MSLQTAAASPQSPVQNALRNELLDVPLVAVSEWHHEQFERHLRYARSLGLSPDSASRFALQQLQTAKAHQAASRATQ